MAFELKTHAVPRIGDAVRPVRAVAGLARALRLQPGYQLAVRSAATPAAAPLRWEVFTDAYNAHYLHCAHTGAVAYFELSDAELRFTAYYGPRHAWLHELYLAAYRVPLCYLAAPSCAALPLPALRLPGLLGWLQDVAAPFGQFVQPRYSLRWPGPEPGPAAQQLALVSEVTLRYFGRERLVQRAELLVVDGALASLRIAKAGQDPLQLVFSRPEA